MEENKKTVLAELIEANEKVVEKVKTTKLDIKPSNWFVHGDIYLSGPHAEQTSYLPNAVYKIGSSEKGWYVKHMESKFSFNYKLYDMDTKFINRVIKTYQSTNKNLGILLNGHKGTGKTVTAKQICNLSGLPVLTIHEALNGVEHFINSIKQDIVIFIDEYEKIYENEANILTVMDGVLSNGHRRIFVFTTNTLRVNVNLLSRPGRIRYLKTYSDLSLDIVEEMIDDMLENKEHRSALLEFVKTLSLVTVDIVKAIIEEVNIHDEVPENFKRIFNVNSESNLFNVYVVLPPKPKKKKEDDEVPSYDEDGYPYSESEQPEYRLENQYVNISPMEITPASVGESFKVSHQDIGVIKSVDMAKDTFVVETDRYMNNRQKRCFTFYVQPVQKRVRLNEHYD